MPVHRRLTAALAAASLGWAVLTLGVGSPPSSAADATAPVASAPAAAPHDPATYYAGTEGLSGTTLALKLNSIIDDQTRLSYAQVYDALPFTDEDPANTANLIVFYSGTSLAKTSRCGGGSCAGQWNREHTWPQSHGEISTSGPGADLHHMRPEFADTNSSRGNKDFDDGGTATVPSCGPCRSTSSSFEPRAAVKGDLARGLFYMAVRYNGDSDDGFSGDLELAESIPTSGPRLGRLSTLVAWSLADPPDARERARNDLVDGDFQHNRNPFIDHPEWVCGIWGSQVPAGCATPVNNAPTTSPMTRTTAEDTATSVPLAATDPDGDALTWTVRQAPAHGAATVNGSTLTYTPTADFNGSDQVGVRVSDGRGGVADTTVTITVTPVNDAPVATNVVAQTPSGTSAQVALSGSDVDDTSLTYVVATQPAHGTVTVSGATATYVPAAGYTGPDSFTYTVRDPAGASSPAATVSVTVTAVQQPPTAGNTSVTTAEDQASTFPLPGSGPSGATLTYTVGTAPTHGTVTINGNQATYVPEPDFDDVDSFTYTVRDSTGATSSPATVSVTVTPVNDAPVAQAASASTAEDAAVTLTLSATDVDSPTLTYAVATPPAHGSVVLSGNQATYTPAADFHGPDSFAWTVSDGAATTTSATGITVTSVNDRPTVDAVEATTAQDGAVTIPLVGSDVDGDLLTFAVGTDPAHGTVEVAGTTVTYTPTPGSRGTDTFTYTASDGLLTSPPATVTVTVTPVAATAQLVLFTSTLTRGDRATATILAAGQGDQVPTGTVTLLTVGKNLGSATLRPDGTASVSWVPGKAGVTHLVAYYSGDDRYASALSPLESPTAARSAARTTIAAGVLKRGRAGVVKVSVRTVAGVPATGTVAATIGSKRMTARLVRGVATFRVAALPRSARVKVVARYAGDTQYAAGSATRTLPLKR